MKNKIVLIDGHSILNRAFYGVPDLTNAEGFHTNAIYGFLNIMFKILDEEKAEYLTVAFDVKEPTFRHEIFEQYKGTRKPMPEELREQVPKLKELLIAMGIQIVEKPGLEADDILGTLAKKAEAQGFEVSLVSGDRDLLQIATEQIKIRIPKTKGGQKTEVEDYYAADVFEKYQVTPLQFIELKALMGDTADNIPGVPKIGEKTATDLLVTYHSIENIYENIEEITKKSVKATLLENRHLAELSKVLATIKIDAEFPFSMEHAKYGNLYTKEAYEIFANLEFKNMLSRFEKDIVRNDEADDFVVISDLQEAEEVFSQCEKQEVIGFSIVEGNANDFTGISITYAKDKQFFLKLGGFLTREYLMDKLDCLSELFREKHRILATFDAKKEYEHFSCESVTHFFDIKLAAYLLNPLKSDYSMEDIAQEQLMLTIPSFAQKFGKKSYVEAMEEDAETFAEYACFLSHVIYFSYEILKEKLENTGMDSVFYEMETPLTYVLFKMEQEGVKVKGEELKEYSKILAGQIDQLQVQIYEMVGCEFNINSPKQLGEILFEKLEIPGGKKTKSGYSTAADVLEKLAPEYPVISKILEYRGLAKLKSTYADGLVDYIKEDGRIHTSFNQMIAATGRISSTAPNLQNIPMRMELGRLIRKVFVPKDGFVFLDADYSQIELRILAHMAKDTELIEAYRTGKDIHRITASKVFHTPFEEVTELQRRNAKAVNFGIVYGISSFGLSQDLSISRKEAKEYIDHYFETYQGVKQFLVDVVEKAKENGYTSTIYGRRRPIPELASSNFMQRSFGERAAMNSPIQGTAADIMKIAMINVYNAIKEAGLESRLVLQVHDELLVETKIGEEEQVTAILKREMEEAAQMLVSLDVDIHMGNNWYEAK